MKKLLIAAGVIAVLGLITVLIIFNMDWGERTSTVEKTEIEEAVDSVDENGIILPSLDDLEGMYDVDTESGKAELLFEIDGLKNTKGAFEKFEASFDIKDDFATSLLRVKIDAASINTENDMRDDHLKEPDYFDVKKYPNIIFESDNISFEEGTYTASGDLEFLGNTNSMDITFEHNGGQDLEGDVRIEVFEGSFEFDRTQYGMEEESGIGNIVSITFYVELEKS